MEDAWGDLVQNEILGPLQMNSSGTNCSDANVCFSRLFCFFSSLFSPLSKFVDSCNLVYG